MKRFLLNFFGWTLLLDIPIFLSFILLLRVYDFYKETHPLEQEFELFLVRSFYDYEDPIYWNKEPTTETALDIEWNIDTSKIHLLDAIPIEITNNGNHFYAEARDVRDNFWIHAHYVKHQNGKTDTTTESMWCGTGSFYQYVSTGETITYEWNSLFDKITFRYNLDFKVPQYTSIIDSTFGDSTELYWTLWTFSPPWSNYVPQTVYSPSYMIYTENIKKAWKNSVAFPRKRALSTWFYHYSISHL